MGKVRRGGYVFEDDSLTHTGPGLFFVFQLYFAHNPQRKDILL